MIGKLKLWTQNIIIAVIISIIIEMILPDTGSNKKYVKVVSGLYILYVIINPILNLGASFKDFKIEDFIKNENIISTVAEETDVAKTYILSMENSLKANIEKELNYKVQMVEFTLLKDYSEIVKIKIEMKPGQNYDSRKIIEVVQKSYSINNIEIC